MRRILLATTITLLTAVAPSALAITTFLADPNDPLYLANDAFYSGVARLTINKPGIGSVSCTGSLLSGGLTLLTAAHCVTQAGSLISGTTVDADFGGFGTFSSGNISVFPTYNSATNFGDLALVFLGGPVTGAQTYNLYRNSDEAGQIGDIVGFGRFGSGATGSVNAGNGVRRHGSNLVDYVASTSGLPASGGSATFLAFDFDNGTADQNALGLVDPFLYSNLGVGNSEVGAARGDSGGPTFLNNQVAGVTSFGACFGDGNGNCGMPPDVNSTVDSSFGELFFNTRVSSYADWIDQEMAEIPEPNTLVLLGAGLAIIAGTRSRRY